MFEQLQAKKLSTRTIKYVHSTLREALQHAFKMQLIPRNAADFVTLPKQVKFRSTAYKESEVISMLTASNDTDMEAPLNIAVGLGLRRGELFGLRWSDIDLVSNKITIVQNLVYIDGKYIFGPTKSQAGNRTLEMPLSLAKVLKKHKKRQAEYRLLMGKDYKTEYNLVCAKPDGSPINPGSFSHKFVNFLNRNGLRQIRFHDLRHTNASLMLQYNVPAKVASQRLGHSSIGITLDLYSHVIGDLQTEAANKIDVGIFQKLQAIGIN